MDIPDTPPPSHHADDSATSFQNPWPPKSLLASHQVFSQFPLALAKRIEGEVKSVKVVRPDFARDVSDEGVIKATWLGHAGFLVQLPRLPGCKPIRILFDPIWSERASPHQSAGPRRRLPPPCKLQELPDFQFVVTSHNHYDHLDYPTIDHIYKMKGTRVQFLAPLGNASWFRECGIPEDQVTQLDWYDSVKLQPSGTLDKYPSVKFICTPAQHASGRGLFDQRETLWSSWVVQQESEAGTTSVYHAGNRGEIRPIRPRDGPDLARFLAFLPLISRPPACLHGAS
ncbi:hypothetical protein NM688_g6271 [Phlebia brevispora]|uniref:Uncharacterized protein n=1 Tax=Phlebia brevispora TaxID=194682 RepID=A0ACC1SHR1_9APHY|nr:hypothetical protein NM688_g6271 [Phlebia brevispora]